MEPVPTGSYLFWHSCPWCRGTGRHPRQLDGWYVTYPLRDGTETSGPFSREEAVAVYRGSDPRRDPTLVGPDGQVYRLEG